MPRVPLSCCSLSFHSTPRIPKLNLHIKHARALLGPPVTAAGKRPKNWQSPRKNPSSPTYLLVHEVRAGPLLMCEYVHLLFTLRPLHQLYVLDYAVPAVSETSNEERKIQKREQQMKKNRPQARPCLVSLCENPRIQQRTKNRDDR